MTRRPLNSSPPRARALQSRRLHGHVKQRVQHHGHKDFVGRILPFIRYCGSRPRLCCFPNIVARFEDVYRSYLGRCCRWDYRRRRSCRSILLLLVPSSFPVGMAQPHEEVLPSRFGRLQSVPRLLASGTIHQWEAKSTSLCSIVLANAASADLCNRWNRCGR